MLERLRDRLGQRPSWKLAAVALAIAAALAVVVIGSGGQPSPTSSAGRAGLGAFVVTGGRQLPPAAATAAARRFLAGYLRFLYGQADPGALRAISPQLRRWLGAHRTRVAELPLFTMSNSVVTFLPSRRVHAPGFSRGCKPRAAEADRTDIEHL